MREIVPDVLWIGNVFDARNIKAVMDAGFQIVVDLAIEEPPIQLPREVASCRFPLLDGEGNSPGFNHGGNRPHSQLCQHPNKNTRRL